MAHTWPKVKAELMAAKTLQLLFLIKHMLWMTLAWLWGQNRLLTFDGIITDGSFWQVYWLPKSSLDDSMMKHKKRVTCHKAHGPSKAVDANVITLVSINKKSQCDPTSGSFTKKLMQHVPRLKSTQNFSRFSSSGLNSYRYGVTINKDRFEHHTTMIWLWSALTYTMMCEWIQSEQQIVNNAHLSLV